MEFPQGKRPFSQGLSMLFGTDKRESVLMDGGKVKLVCVQVVEPQYGEVYFLARSRCKSSCWLASVILIWILCIFS